MADCIRLALPWPPSVNHYWRHARGRHYISKKGLAYREAVLATAERAAGLREPLGCRLDVSIVAFPPDARRRDLDNTLKALLDALGAAGIYADDSQIDGLLVQRGPIQRPAGAVVVEVRPAREP